MLLTKLPQPEPEPEPQQPPHDALSAPLGAADPAVEVLRLRALLASTEQVVASQKAELVASAAKVRRLEEQLDALAGGQAVPIADHQAEVWARHAAQREAAAARSELSIIRQQKQSHHESAVSELLWLEGEAKRGRASQLELQIEEAKHRTAASRVQMLESELERLTDEVRELRTRGAGVHYGVRAAPADARATERLAPAAPRPPSRPSSPRALLPKPVASVYDHWSGAGAKANLKAEMRRVAEHQRELGAHQRDLAAA